MAAATEGAANALREEGNALFKAGNFLKAAAVYTQAIKADPSNAALYSNRSAAFLNLLKVTKALSDAEMTVKLKPTWEKGYFRKGCALEAMERYDDALLAYREALQQNPQSSEVATKIKRLSQLIRDRKRARDKHAALFTNSNAETVLDQLKCELQAAMPDGKGEKIWSFTKENFEDASKDCIDNNGKLKPMVHFMFDEASKSSKESALVAVEKAFESPDTLSSCVSFLRQHAIDTSSVAACLVVAKDSIAFPQVWKGQGSRKWKHSQADGYFLQLESSSFRKSWFVPILTEKGRTICREPEVLDVDLHAILPPLFR